MNYCASCGSVVPASGVCGGCGAVYPASSPPPPPMRGSGGPGFGSQPYPARPPGGGSNMFSDFISFRLMVTPLILTILYCATAVLSFFGIILLMAITMGATGGFGAGVVGLFIGVILGVLVQIPIRMYFEILILLFKIKDDLGDIRKSTMKP